METVLLGLGVALALGGPLLSIFTSFLLGRYLFQSAIFQKLPVQFNISFASTVAGVWVCVGVLISGAYGIWAGFDGCQFGAAIECGAIAWLMFPYVYFFIPVGIVTAIATVLYLVWLRRRSTDRQMPRWQKIAIIVPPVLFIAAFGFLKALEPSVYGVIDDRKNAKLAEQMSRATLVDFACPDALTVHVTADGTISFVYLRQDSFAKDLNGRVIGYVNEAGIAQPVPGGNSLDSLAWQCKNSEGLKITDKYNGTQTSLPPSPSQSGPNGEAGFVANDYRSDICPFITHDMSVGSTDAGTGRQVTLLQDFLQLQNQYLKDPTGVFDDYTMQAVANWQKYMGFSARVKSIGSVDSVTRDEMNHLCVQD